MSTMLRRVLGPIALVVVGLACLILSIAIIADAGLGERGAAIASWLEAISTFLALAAAGVASVFAWRAFQLEVQREDRYAKERDRAQAERFSGWCDEVEDNVSIDGTQYWSGLVDAIYLRNASDLPVYRVFGIVRTADGTRMGDLEIGIVPPSDELKVVTFTTEIAHEVDAARREHERRAAANAAAAFQILESFRLQVELLFTDAANVGWRRLADGKLVPINP